MKKKHTLRNKKNKTGIAGIAGIANLVISIIHMVSKVSHRYRIGIAKLVIPTISKNMPKITNLRIYWNC
jgi:hypothetical protein